ncbi:hypothetical protein GJ496_003714 [Pomphorhynchus laevis]|nr:hypothetical protein GJ496_003714 [Pomphorhynchus laevis]
MPSPNKLRNTSKRTRVIESDDSEEDKTHKKSFITKSDSTINPIFNPKQVNFNPVKAATWTCNSEGLPFSAFAQTMQCLEQTTKRLEIVQYVTNLYRSIIETLPDELLPTIYLCLNKVAPDYEGIELGIGEGVLIRSIAEVTGRSVNAIKSDMKTMGDLGLVAESSRSKQKEIATMSGKDSVQQKLNCIKSMFVACKGVEARYFIRSLQALAHACAYSFETDKLNRLSTDKRKAMLDSYTNTIKEAFAECSSYDKIIETLITTRDIHTLLSICTLTPGIPIKPMLAHPTKSVDEILRRFENGKFVCEYKYDGERAQIHLISQQDVRIFSRNSEDNTTKFPDVVDFVHKAVIDKSTFKNAVLDSEIVAYDRNTKQILPFQVLSHRKRKVYLYYIG